MTHLTVINAIFKKISVQGSLNPNITFLGDKLWPVAWKKQQQVLYEEKSRKNSYKKHKNENFEKQKMCFFLMSQESLNPKIRFLG